MQERDYANLVQRDRVSADLYNDQSVFDAEMLEIFGRTWLFVAHESELPRPGDYVTRRAGNVELILSRSKDSGINALVNRCSHRGNLLCEARSGHANVLRCVYHGWTFDNSGKIIGRTFPDAYSKSHGKQGDNLDLTRVGACEVYRGFIFVRLAQRGPSLSDYLGDARRLVDGVVERSPEGEIEVIGTYPLTVRANWKMIAENATDDLHPAFVHRSVTELDGAYRSVQSSADKEATAVSRSLGRGNAEFSAGTSRREIGASWTERPSDVVMDEYRRRLDAAWGPERTVQVSEWGHPHATVFPSLFFTYYDLRRTVPLAPGISEHHVHCYTLKGAPDEYNEWLIRRNELTFGPFGFVMMDDIVTWERNQTALDASALGEEQWLDLSRGMHREKNLGNGIVESKTKDETTIRGMWAYYRSLMEGDDV